MQRPPDPVSHADPHLPVPRYQALLRLTFRNRSVCSTSGPSTWFEFRGPELCGSNEVSVARYEEGRWRHAGEAWPHIECRAILVVQFADLEGGTGPLLGPRPTFRVRDGYAFVGRECIARLNTAGTWTRPKTKDVWRAMRVQPCHIAVHSDSA